METSYIGTQPSSGGVVVQEAITDLHTISGADFALSTTDSATGLLITVTPTDTNNKIIITVNTSSTTTTVSSSVTLSLKAGGTLINGSTRTQRGSPSATNYHTMSIEYEYLPTSLSAVTFEVWGKTSAGGGSLHGNVTNSSSISAREVSPNKIMPSGTLQGIVLEGTGTPEGVVTANVGALFTRTDGGASTTLYVKESGTGSTGWVAK